MKDSDNITVKAGDTIVSSYGIPPARIEGLVEKRGNRLWVLTPGHSPAECSLGKFKEYLGEFWKV